MYDKYWFWLDGKHKDTWWFTDRRWFKKDRTWVYTWKIYDNHGYDIDSYDEHGFDRDWLHRLTKKEIDVEWYDKNGYKQWYNKQWFDKLWKHKDTQSQWDAHGLDVNGKYNPNFDTGKKRKSDWLCPFCSGTGKVRKRSARHQSSDSEDYIVLFSHCLGDLRLDE